jgi:hypothetical protein
MQLLTQKELPHSVEVLQGLLWRQSLAVHKLLIVLNYQGQLLHHA